MNENQFLHSSFTIMPLKKRQCRHLDQIRKKARNTYEKDVYNVSEKLPLIDDQRFILETSKIKELINKQVLTEASEDVIEIDASCSNKGISSEASIRPKKLQTFPAISHINRNLLMLSKKGEVLTPEKSKLILVYYYNMLKKERKKLVKNKSRYKRCDIVGMVAANLGFRRARVKEVIMHWEKHHALLCKKRIGNTKNHARAISSDQDLRKIVSDFINEENQKKRPVYATNVANFLQKNHMHYISSKSTKKSALIRTIRRFLVKNLFSRGPKYDKTGPDIEKIQRNFHYLSTIEQIRSNGEFRMCYLDESYVNIHHNNLKFSLFDPLHPKKLHGAVQKKGPRVCIVSAIIGRAPGTEKTPFEELKPEEKPQLLKSTIWTFLSQKNTKDYHCNFNSATFKDWWVNKLLPALGIYKNQRFCIVLDNAKYHCSYRPLTVIPSSKDKVKILRQKMIDLGFKGCNGLKKKDLFSKFQNEKSELLGYEVDKVAKSKNYMVLRTPPHRSDLQPIEFVWAMLKRWIADQYSEKTNYTKLGIRLKDSFKRICDHPEKVDNMIKHVVKLEVDCLARIKLEYPDLT